MRTFKFMGESSCVADKQVEALKLLASQNVQSNSPQSENRAGQRFSLVCRYLYLQRSDGIRNKQSRREQHIVRRRPVDLHLQQLEAMLAHHHHHHYYYCPLVDLLLDQAASFDGTRWFLQLLGIWWRRIEVLGPEQRQLEVEGRSVSSPIRRYSHKTLRHPQSSLSNCACY